MTAQITEKLTYKDKEFSMCAQPLDYYFDICDIKFESKGYCSALWRGYIGTWEIINDRLYLIDIEGDTNEYGKLKLTTFFPSFPERVFAHWFSGTLRLPKGKLLDYVHMGYGSTYEHGGVVILNALNRESNSKIITLYHAKRGGNFRYKKKIVFTKLRLLETSEYILVPEAFKKYRH